MSTVVLVSIIVPLVFWLLCRKFPNRTQSESRPTLEELAPVYRKWALLTLPILFFYVIPLGFAWWFVLRAIGDAWVPNYPSGVFQLLPSGSAWGIPAMFLGLVSTLPLGDATYRLLLKDRYQEYVRYGNLKLGTDFQRLTVPFIGIVVFLVLGAVILILNWYVVFTDTEIILNPLFSLSEQHRPYSSIVSIETSTRIRAFAGNVVNRREPEYLLYFEDRNTWPTFRNPADLTGKLLHEMMNFVSGKSGIPTSQIDILDWYR